MFKSGVAITRSYLMFRPFVILATLGTVFGVLALVPFVRFGWLWLTEDGNGPRPVAHLRHFACSSRRCSVLRC